MSYSHTTTATFTKTHARYVAGKVAADLRQLRQAYGKPSDDQIDAFMAELTMYLADGYLDYVEYGFVRGGTWVPGAALKYTAAELGSVSVDDRSGRVTRGADIRGATWMSFLELNERWFKLSADSRARYEASLPIKRDVGAEPSTHRDWNSDRRTYSAGSGGVRRYSAS